MSDERTTSVLSVQDVLSFGYLYLLALGIVSDSIYYALIGISFMDYADVLDVLLTPLRYLEREPRFTVIMVLITGGSYVSIRWLRQRHAHRALADEAYRERLGEEGLRAVPRRLRILKFLIPAVGVFAGYVGFATGSGVRIKEGLREGTVRADHRIVFTNGEQADVRVVGLTGNYLFYVPAERRTVFIAPIQAVVRSIELLPR